MKQRKKVDSKLLRNSCIIVDREIERFFWLRQELKKYKSPSVCSMKVCQGYFLKLSHVKV